ncbi:MAG TPA: YoaK family protein, partial [Solirubrobacteraceae bacterium]
MSSDAATPEQTRLRDVLLVTLTLSVGAIDAISVVVLGKVFSAFMTGNLVYLGLEAAGGDGPPTLRLVIALVAFGAGAFAAARAIRPAGEGRLWPASTTAVLLATAGLELALWVVWLVVDGRPGTATGDVLIGGYAFAMGMQTSAIFSLGVRAVFTTAATATWTVLMADAANWRESRQELVR